MRNEFNTFKCVFQNYNQSIKKIIGGTSGYDGCGTDCEQPGRAALRP